LVANGRSVVLGKAIEEGLLRRDNSPFFRRGGSKTNP
jgi:hypothetical protein